MEQVRYFSDDRDHECPKEIIITWTSAGDYYIAIAEAGKNNTDGVRIAGSGGASAHAPDLFTGIGAAFNAIKQECLRDEASAKQRGMQFKTFI